MSLFQSSFVSRPLATIPTILSGRPWTTWIIGSSALPHSLPVRLGFLRGRVLHCLLGKMDLPVEPDVFLAIAVVDAVDHCRYAIHIGLLSCSAARLDNYRP